MMSSSGGWPAAPVTNPKVASLEPAWAQYRGLSVLFDNPGRPPPAGLVRLEELTSDTSEAQALYDQLDAIVSSPAAGRLRDEFGFCPLPRFSYHVTVCDGPNEQELARKGGPLTADLSEVVLGLPDSLANLPAAADVLLESSLLAAARDNPVTFTVQQAAIWGHVLAAQLEPADKHSTAALSRIAEARRELTHGLSSGLGLSTQQWRPHVSLGYFANRDAAGAATGTLTKWNDRLTQSATASIRFESAAVYAFTDMVTFLRIGD